MHDIDIAVQRDRDAFLTDIRNNCNCDDEAVRRYATVLDGLIEWSKNQAQLEFRASVDKKGRKESEPQHTVSFFFRSAHVSGPFWAAYPRRTEDRWRKYLGSGGAKLTVVPDAVDDLSPETWQKAQQTLAFLDGDLEKQKPLSHPRITFENLLLGTALDRLKSLLEEILGEVSAQASRRGQG